MSMYGQSAGPPKKKQNVSYVSFFSGGRGLFTVAILQNKTLTKYIFEEKIFLYASNRTFT